MRKTRLKVKGDNSTALIKQKIQDILRLIVTHRDGGCILRDLRCGVTAVVEDGKILASSSFIQADHLVTRANSATFANYHLVVCVCNGCHAWKNWNKDEYEELVKSVLPKKTIQMWELAEEYRKAHKTHKMDWNMQLVGLQLTLKDYDTKMVS